MISYAQVAPFVGAWIEIELKLAIRKIIKVAPFVGAWIEITKSCVFSKLPLSRSLRGSVD